MFSKSDNENPILNNYGLTKLPPGHLFSDKFPVLTYGATPSIILDNWKFEVSGLVNEKVEWNWDEFKQLPMQNLIADFHCVTHWSRFDDVWSGVMFKDCKVFVEGSVHACTSCFTHKLRYVVGLVGKSAADKGKDTRDYLAAVFFLNDAATTEVYTRSLVGSVGCV